VKCKESAWDAAGGLQLAPPPPPQNSCAITTTLETPGYATALSDSHFFFLSLYFLPFFKHFTGGWNSSVGIATRYGLEGSGIGSRGGRDFPQSFRSVLRPTQSAIQWGLGLFPGGKAAWACR
jgi:hypothetical protein